MIKWQVIVRASIVLMVRSVLLFILVIWKVFEQILIQLKYSTVDYIMMTSQLV